MSEKSKSEDSSPAPQPPVSKPSSAAQSTTTTPSSVTPPPGQPLTDFMGMLKMKRSSDESQDTDRGDEKVKEGINGGESVMDDAEERMETEVTALPGETLTDMFKRDPSSVLKLLESALSMDRLSSLLASEHKQDKKKVDELRSKLEAAYHTLKDCAEQKGALSAKIESTNEKIRTKRKQLEGLREELRILGEEELQLKRKRDASYTNCADLKKKLKSSRDALQQLAVLAPAKNNKGATSGDGSRNTT